MNKVIVTILTLVSLLILLLGPLSWGSSQHLHRNIVVWLALAPGSILLLDAGVKWLSHQKANQVVREIRIRKGVGSYPGEQGWQRKVEEKMTLVFWGIILGTTAEIVVTWGLAIDVILLTIFGLLFLSASLAFLLWELRLVAKLKRPMEESFRSKAQKDS